MAERPRRARRAYDDRSARPLASAKPAIDITVPVAGFYRLRLRSGGVLVGISLWHGAPHDPVTGEEMDRSWRWQAHANGDPIDFDRVWPACAGDPISRAEYDMLCRRQTWARENAPSSSYADPRRRIDPLGRGEPSLF